MKSQWGHLLDISIPVRPGTPEWPGDTPYSCGWTWSVAAGESVNVSSITMSPHVGTHADAPLHVRDDGSPIDRLPLGHFSGPAYVLGVEGAPRDISFEELSSLLPDIPERLLLRTGASVAEGRFPDDWPVPSEDAAFRLRTAGMLLLGTDAPSVDRRESKSLEVHHAIFRGGGCNLENLNLNGVPNGWYELTAYPIRLEGMDAAPVRAVLRRLAAPQKNPPPQPD
ncbi:MAG TPA: cyclase family protein [Gemmatimonadales bacterium]|nr:cyclase family protein [Gemmatimonadales bacterium]